MYQGYIKLWRKIQDSDLWKKEKFTRGQAWIDLIMLANHKDGYIRKRGIRVELQRGDIGWSERELSKRWKWSRNKVRRFLNELCSDNESKLAPQTIPQNKNITSYYSIVNYKRYQGIDTTNDTTKEPQKSHKRYQNKNVKNDKNKYSADFLEFYSAYPLKKSKAKAFQSWQKIKPDLSICLSAIQSQMIEKSFLKAEKKFCPEWKHPSTWLNQQCWEDEVETEPKIVKEYI